MPFLMPFRTSNAFSGFSALLLAAGEGKRLRPITLTIPKCLAPIVHAPLLEIWLEILCGNGIERVLINTHYLKESVENFCNTSQYCSRIELIYEPELLGSVGTLMQNKSKINDKFLLAHADNLSIFQPKDFVKMFLERPSGFVGTAMTFDADDPGSCGIIECDDNNVFSALHHKVDNPPSCLANAAVFLLDKSIYNFIDERNDFDFCADVMPKLVGKLNLYKNNIYHRDIGTPISLKVANNDYLKMLQKGVV